MGRVPILFICIMLQGCESAPTKHDPWFSKDKFYHFGASAVAAGATAAAAHANGSSDNETFQAALEVTLILGVGKEAYDVKVKKKSWSWKDLFWGIMGGVAGYGIVNVSN